MNSSRDTRKVIEGDPYNLLERFTYMAFYPAKMWNAIE